MPVHQPHLLSYQFCRGIQSAALAPQKLSSEVWGEWVILAQDFFPASEAPRGLYARFNPSSLSFPFADSCVEALHAQELFLLLHHISQTRPPPKHLVMKAIQLQEYVKVRFPCVQP